VNEQNPRNEVRRVETHSHIREVDDRERSLHPMSDRLSRDGGYV
jgi:hypothetical protein